MNLTDTHAHLYWDSFKEDFDQVIQRAVDAGVSTIINVGVDVETSKKALQQVKTYPWPKDLKVYSTIGIHPHEAVKFNNRQTLHGRDIFVQKDIDCKVIAVGECGLDFKEVDEPTKKLQCQLFQAQIDLAKKLNLPLIVHCRGAWDEVIDMTKDHFGIYHCYSGLPHTTSYILHNTNFLVSFAGNLTYPKNEYLREAVKTLPLDRIVLETDCPFLPPQSKRGQRNEPSSILETAQLIAEIKGVTLEEVASQTTKNVKTIFNLDPSTRFTRSG